MLLAQAPAAMLCGTLPTTQLLHKHGLEQSAWAGERLRIARQPDPK
eukprot:COSAG02_NODE_11996_length_1617_cov_1.503953_1_plen_45_part_10